MTEQSKIQNLKSEDSAERAGAGGQGDSIDVRPFDGVCAQGVRMAHGKLRQKPLVKYFGILKSVLTQPYELLEWTYLF